MINALRRAAALWTSAAAVIFAVATPAFSQAPTDAQRSAIRSECRSDYEAHCASIPPGGAASLQCLQQNISSLSSSCQTAVRAVEAPATPKAEPAPAAATATPATTAAPPTPKAAAGTAAKKPSNAQVAAIRSSCRADYQKTCAGVPTGAAALNCLEKNKSKLSASCQKAVDAASGGATTPAAGGVPAAAATASPGAAPAAPAPVLVLRPMRPREELSVLRSACGGDVRALCGSIPPGGGRIVQCLAAQAASLSPACRDVLARFAAQ